MKLRDAAASAQTGSIPSRLALDSNGWSLAAERVKAASCITGRAFPQQASFYCF